jgi:thioredoxin-related protein
MKTRRDWLSFALLLIAINSVTARARAQNRPKSNTLPWPDHLPRLAALAQRQGQPMLLMVSLPGCPWCELLRRNYLGPMRQEGVHAYEFMINDSKQQLVDFSSQTTTPAQWSERHKISISPTLLFFNAQGQEIAARLEGVASADLIGTMLEDRLAQARSKIPAPKS